MGKDTEKLLMKAEKLYKAMQYKKAAKIFNSLGTTFLEIGNFERIKPSKMEFDILVNRGERLLLDTRNESISIDGRFSLVYRAAHCLCTAALRWHGYKARGNRFGSDRHSARRNWYALHCCR